MDCCDLKPGCVRFADGGIERCAICAFFGDSSKNVILVSYRARRVVLAEDGAFTRTLVPGVGISRKGNTVVVNRLSLDPHQLGPAEEHLLGAAQAKITFQGRTFFADYLSPQELEARA